MPLLWKCKRYHFIGAVTAAGMILSAGCEADQELNADYRQVQLAAHEHSEETSHIRHLTFDSLTPVMEEAATEFLAPRVLYYGVPGHTFNVLSTKGEYMQLENEEVGRVWIPSWYAEEASNQIQATAFSRVRLQSKTKASLFPNSQLKMTLNSNSPIYTAYRWKDWYGVIIPADRLYDQYEIYAPMLLWVRDKDLSEIELVENGLWRQSEEIGMENVRSVIEVVLQQGVSQSTIRNILGKPDVIETSSALNETDEPLRLGAAWRYEDDKAHVIATFSEKGLLEKWTWTAPLTEPAQLDVSRIQYPYIQMYDFRELALSPSIEMDWSWRNQGSLAFTVLEAASDDVLLIRGDDGGFSGMHYHSSLYAIDEQTGKKLWQVDGGWELMAAQLDHKRENVSIFTRYDPKLKEYRSVLRHIRLSDGEILWSYEGPQMGDWMSSAKDALFMYTTPDQEHEGFLLGLDPQSGKKLWERRMTEDFIILNQTGSEPVLLLQEGNWLKAIHPRTGKIKWSLAGEKTSSDVEIYINSVIMPPRNPLTADEAHKGWIQLRNELLLIDWNKGTVLTSYPLKKDQFIEVVDNTLLLVQSRGDTLTGTAVTTMKTTLVDAKTHKRLWSLSGKGSGALIEGDIMYLLVDGIPAAIDQRTGEMHWQSPRTKLVNQQGSHFGRVVSANPLLFAVGRDLLHVNPSDGSIIGRSQDELLGHTDAFMRKEQFPIREDILYIGSANGYFSKLDLSGLPHE